MLKAITQFIYNHPIISSLIMYYSSIQYLRNHNGKLRPQNTGSDGLELRVKGDNDDE